MRAFTRNFTLLFAAIVTLLATGANAEEIRFPYQAQITGGDVYIRSGPGKNYYPTDKLQRGNVVEVYRHDPGGWYAIRPPRRSFSWIAATNLRLSENNLAEVTGAGVMAYVGSNFSDVRDVHQVRLEAGEVVEIIGMKRFIKQGGGTAETWYKTASPAGEFRWVSSRFIARYSGRASGFSSNNTTDAPQSEPVAAVSRPREPIHDAVRPVDFQEPEARSPEAVRIPGSAIDSDQIAVRGYDESINTPPSGSSTTPNSRFKREVEQLDLELSLMVAEEPSVWHFGQLRSAAQVVLEDSKSAVDRGRARVILRDIAKYQTLRDEYEAIAAIRRETDRSNRVLQAARDKPAEDYALPRRNEDIATTSVLVDAGVDNTSEQVAVPPTAGAESTSASGEVTHDFGGAGRLKSVVSRRRNAPRYAVVDPQGKILMLVRPAAGLDLGKLVGKSVSVRGTVRNAPELKNTPVITASRVELIQPR